MAATWATVAGAVPGAWPKRARSWAQSSSWRSTTVSWLRAFRARRRPVATTSSEPGTGTSGLSGTGRPKRFACHRQATRTAIASPARHALTRTGTRLQRLAVPPPTRGAKSQLTT